MPVAMSATIANIITACRATSRTLTSSRNVAGAEIVVIDFTAFNLFTRNI
jgi:hypothetical protein